MIKLLTCCFAPKTAFNPDENQGQNTSGMQRQPVSDVPLAKHNRRRNPSSLERRIRQFLRPTVPPHASLFDTTKESAAVRDTIKWLEEVHYALGNENNGLPGKPILAETPAAAESNGQHKTDSLGARLADDKVAVLHVSRDGIVPGRNDGLFGLYLDNTTLCPLAPDQLGAIGKITRPIFPLLEQNLEPRVVNIDVRTAQHLVCARATIDLVKALLPFGAGNQIKDMVRTGGESHLRSVLAKRATRYVVSRAAPDDKCIHRAKAAIRWKSGFCDENAALAFAILRSLPELKDARIDWIINHKLHHNIAIIRGDKPEHDVMVDPWATFAIPCLPADAADDFQEMAQRPELNPDNKIVSSKSPGALFPALDIAAELRKHEKLSAEFKDPHEQYEKRLYFSTAPKGIHDYLTNTKDPDMWDLPYNGNPNVRYQLEGEDGEAPMMMRFDMQRVEKSLSDESSKPSSSRAKGKKDNRH